MDVATLDAAAERLITDVEGHPPDAGAAAATGGHATQAVAKEPVAHAGKTRLPLDSDDRFLASAAREFQENQIDQALWARALAQSGDDEARAIDVYLRGRATALQ